jgi:hypothetical protein
MTELRLDWCNYEAAKYAVERWHYSRCMPKSKLARLGVWEDGQFIGCVLFGVGATGDLVKSFGLDKFQGCELVRVALASHKTPVSRINAIALKLLKRDMPGLRLVVSFADPEHGHAGGIYQAGGWTYTGDSIPADEYIIRGKRWHGRSLRNTKPQGMTTEEYAKALDLNYQKIKGSSKHRYLYPLDDAMRKQIEPLRKPYPKRDRGETDSAPQSNAETEGARPIRSLTPSPPTASTRAGEL